MLENDPKQFIIPPPPSSKLSAARLTVDSSGCIALKVLSLAKLVLDPTNDRLGLDPAAVKLALDPTNDKVALDPTVDRLAIEPPRVLAMSRAPKLTFDPFCGNGKGLLESTLGSTMTVTRDRLFNTFMALARSTFWTRSAISSGVYPGMHWFRMATRSMLTLMSISI
eukprot:scaffold307_cov162-Amphora_coffeaeformis.AAC.7